MKKKKKKKQYLKSIKKSELYLAKYIILHQSLPWLKRKQDQLASSTEIYVVQTHINAGHQTALKTSPLAVTYRKI